MCGRFAQALPLGKLKKIELFSNLDDYITESYNVAPGDDAGIIIYREKPELVISRWGFTGQTGSKGSAPRLIINARSESVAGKFIFKKSFQQYRCVIPVSGFYEWKHSGTVKEPMFIYPASDGTDDSSIFFLAGIYRAADDKILFTVITRDSTGLLKDIHDRMPVCIPQSKLKNWLTPHTDAREVQDIMINGYISEFSYQPVSNVVNNPSNKTIECITPPAKENFLF